MVWVQVITKLLAHAHASEQNGRLHCEGNPPISPFNKGGPREIWPNTKIPIRLGRLSKGL